MATAAAPDVYAELPAAVEEDAKHLIKPKAEGESDSMKGKKINAFLRKEIPDNRQREGAIDGLKHRVFFVDNTDKPKKRFDKRRKIKHKLTSKEKRQLGLFKIGKEQKYDSFLPLHSMWLDYMRDLVDFSRIPEEKKTSTAQPTLLKADYHGAMVTVTKARTPSLVGQTGIIVQETKNVFKIVAKDDKMKVIPKDNCVFSVELDGHVLTINGSEFKYAPAERIHRKFKFTPRKPTDL